MSYAKATVTNTLLEHKIEKWGKILKGEKA